MKFLTIGAVALCVLYAAAAQAQLTRVDLQLVARVLGFLEKPLTGTVRLGIVYIPGDDQSVHEADSIMTLLGTGLSAGNLLFAPVRVRIDQAAAAQVDVFFLPEGLADHAKQISDVAKLRKIPCVTLDIAQVRNGICAIGVRVLPKIEIYVNRTAAEDDDTTFGSVFRMMITEF